MSAFICDRKHILYLVQAATHPAISRHSFYWYYNNQSKKLSDCDNEQLAEVANMLWQENIKSVSSRYPNEGIETLPGPIAECFLIEEKDFYGQHVALQQFKPVQVIKACHCYEYQSCEHDEWEKSEAHSFIQALIANASRSLPGYEDAAWGAPDNKKSPSIAHASV